MASPTTRRLGLVVAGLVMGLLGVALGLWFYLQAARIEEVRTNIGARLQIAREAIERVQVLANDELRFHLRDVALLDEVGDTILAAPRVALTLDATKLGGSGPIELYDIDLVEPYARVVQSPGGEWNYLEAFRITAAGAPVETEPGRPIHLRDITVTDGRILLAFPGGAPGDGEGAIDVNVPVRVVGGVTYHEYAVTDVQATLPFVRIGGPAGWRAEVGAFTGTLAEPAIQIAELSGFAEESGEDAVELAIDVLRFGDSVLSAAGVLTYLDDGVLYDATVRTEALRFADLRPILPGLIGDGTAAFELTVESLTPGRVALAFSGLDVEAIESRVLGQIDIAIGGGTPVALLDADLELSPLRLSSLEELGLATDLPLLGDVTGRVSTDGAPDGVAAVDLRASLFERGQPTATPSVVFASGTVAVGDAFAALRLDGLNVGFRPLRLEMLSAFFPDQADRLRGSVEGSIAVAGTLSELRLDDGILVYDVGTAPQTRLTGLTGTIDREPELLYDLSAAAQPLALATLTELFPGLPFRTASVTGPVRVAGDPTGLEISADLDGTAGGIRFDGSLTFGDPLSFEVEGEVRAFAAGMILRPEVPVEGPVTGTFAVNGTLDEFAFDVDLAQDEGRAVLEGTLTTAVEPPRFEASGTVTDFRVGILVGDPQLFPDPMTGSIAIAGGAGDPYRFDVDLTGATGRVDVAGLYEPAEVPVYEVSGFVAELDLSRLPLPTPLPSSSITGSVEIDGRGLDLDNLAGTFAFNTTESTIAGMSLDAAVGSVAIADGVLAIDTLNVQLEETTLRASGSWGLRSPAAEPLRYSLTSPDLGVVGRLLAPTDLVPPRVEGNVEAEGTVAGSIEFPIIETRLVGRNVRYEDYSAVFLDLALDARRDPTFGWQGDIVVEGEELYTPQFQRVETLALDATGTEGALAFSLAARRDRQTDITATGVLELDGTVPLGVALETMTLRLEDSDWRLQSPTRLRYTEPEGLVIDNLVLERVSPSDGVVAVSGVVPPSGLADLDVTATDVELAELRRISPDLPAIGGRLDLEAVVLGPVDRPEISITATIDQFAFEGARAELITFDGVLAGNLLVGSAEVTVEGEQLFVADVQIPMSFSLAGLSPSFELLTEAPLVASIVADSLPMDLVTALVPGVSEGAGVAEAQVQIGGTLDQPSLDGWARLVDGAVTVDSLFVRYTDIDADLLLEGNRLLIDSLSARSGGTVTASGTIDFPAGAAPRADVVAALREFRVMDDPSLAELTASGDLALFGPVTEPLLTGEAVITESTIYVPELVRQDPTLELAYLDAAQLGTIPGEDIAPPTPLLGNLRVDGVEVAIGEGVWLESPEMRIQIEGDLILYRSGEDLRVFGALEAVRGTYALDVSGIIREFEVISGRVQFFGTGDLNPSLDIVAGYQIRGQTLGQGRQLTVLVEVGGTILNPTVALTSDAPVPLPESELISYLLFGQPSFELESRFAEQLVVQELFGNILASELQRPFLRYGICDWVRVRPGQTSTITGVFGGTVFTGAAIECGWEVANELFITAETGLGLLGIGGDLYEGRVGLEWQIDNEWMWDAAYGSIPRSPLTRYFDTGPRTQFSTDIRRQWEYGRPSETSPPEILPEDLEAVPPVPPDVPAPPQPADSLPPAPGSADTVPPAGGPDSAPQQPAGAPAAAAGAFYRPTETPRSEEEPRVDSRGSS